jgi:hypothetical protein
MFDLPPKLKRLEESSAGREWLRRLPALVQASVDRWSYGLLDRERARRWALAQTLAWAFEDGRAIERHVETARWLWQA